MHANRLPALRQLQLLALLVLWGCASQEQEPEALPPAVTLATTTSTRDSGLLDVLVPMFEKQTRIKVKVLAVGSGQALELGRRGDADVLLTHSLVAEQKLVAEGYGDEARPVMANDFALLGPPEDPARVKGRASISEAFRRIAESNSTFVSRGDESGTHVKERAIWKAARLEPEGAWYIRAGTGMAEALRMADEKRAYTLADRATFLALRERFTLSALVEGDALLRNPYAVIVVSARKHPKINHAAARRFAEFLESPDVQRKIGEFGIDQFGEPLFHPQAFARSPN